ncbi:unnamed protein product [Acanthosepion pharaonis]|uniref:Uncharacterized protein n=1 Tax=Acanthosepion pharaonis TaxID=158019 RepID=A0A812BPS2_ACAPH|nr:unnamed protein product [Sepia pharaonis]
MISKKSNKWPNMTDEVFYNLGLVYMGLKDYRKALVAFNHAIDINPRHASCFYHRGLTKIHLNYAQCVIDFNKALSIDPKYFEVYMSRAAYYAMKKNYPKAILNCNEGLKIYKNSVRALLYRGSIKYFIGAYKLAVVDLTKAIELKEDCALAFFNRAICFEALEEYENALCDYSIVHLISDELDYNVFINRGCLYFKMEDFDNARQDFREALKLKPQDCKIIHAWGLCLHKLGKLEEAKEMFTKCLHINCQFSDAFISRGNVYMDYVSEEETVLASYDYQRAIITKPDDVLARIYCEDALEGRAAVCLQMGDTYAAFQDLNAAIRINPTAVLYNNRGVVNQYMKCLRDALTDYKYAIELDPQYALAYYNAGNIYLHGRFFQQALKYFNKAISLDPNDECALINRAVTKASISNFFFFFFQWHSSIETVFRIIILTFCLFCV